MSPFEPPVNTVVRDPENTLKRHAARAFVFLPIGVLAIAIFAGFGVGLLVGVVAVMLLGLFAKDAVQAALRWHPPQLEVAAGAIPLGGVAHVTYRRRPRRPTDVSDCVVDCRLYCREQVTYQRGTDTVTDSKDVFEARTQGTGGGTAEGLVAVLELDIEPTAGGPTLDLEHNEVHWFVEISVSGPRLPKDSHLFELKVGPVLAGPLRARIQDS